MKKILFSLILIVLFVLPLFSQTGYIDPKAGFFTLTFQRDSISATDSTFGRFKLPFNCYYRGMDVESGTGGVATFRLAEWTSDLTNATSIDSCVTSSAPLGHKTGNNGARVGPRTLIESGEVWRLQFVSATNDAFIGPIVTLFFSMN